MNGTATGHLPHYRLTRRGRLVVLALGLLVVALIGVAFASASVATPEQGEGLTYRTVTVEPGDTLWAIAGEAGADDVRSMVARIESLNGVDAGSVQAGDRLRIPLG